MKQNTCPICHDKLSLFKTVKIKDGTKICEVHYEEAGIDLSERIDRIKNKNHFSVDELQDRISKNSTTELLTDSDLNLITSNKQKICPICDQKLTLLKQTLKGGVKVCEKHFGEAGIDMNEILSRVGNEFTLEEIRLRINTVNKVSKELEDEREVFRIDKNIGIFVAFDETQKKWATLSNGQLDRIYDYEDIVNFELLEDGNSVASGGLGRALVGGALFGGTGAIVGGITGKKTTKAICSTLKIKVTMNNMSEPVIYINFIETKTKKDSSSYKILFDSAQECLSILQLICEKADKKTLDKQPVTPAEEITKYKTLLDEGAITEEEFSQLKKKLLGI
ncbi:SHOCT domain-containing protein [Geomicrobium sp. JCM 19038]|uniref:SHOCT domain-containing protein n=1 Tax=Geomicrobium sp. JCM 19038 TaxID=1460635 RepID=UPI00045F2FA2|nr:SHOCT domain-containing protein [Geomicrobium sp. JCM 19038]GAK09594.1 hypothetical protein JCM19038_3436 [Geomicrobium sp. JCM 19038]